MVRRGQRVVLDCSDKSVPANRARTHQSFAKEADINNLMSRYKKTGFFYDPNSMNASRLPRFGDFSDIPDFAVLHDRMSQAEDSFLRLPATVRSKFNNSVSDCLDFITDPNNFDEAVKLGLLDAPLGANEGADQKDSSDQPTAPTAPKA
ncbi:MAG: internal scaffolding protein [Microviridae sp.]|nr:MAG: internal scaffolding protein [Microviridae sp.]